MRRAPLAPEPDLRGRLLAARLPGLIDGMLAENVPAALHQTPQQRAAGALGQVRGNGPVGNVVWRLRFCLPGEGRGSRAAINENISITNARMKFQGGRWMRPRKHAAQGRLDRFDERAALGIRDMAGREVAHGIVVNRHKIAADSPVIRAKRDSHGSRFEGRPAGIDDQRVIAKKAQGGHIAGGGQRGRHIVRTADDPHARQAVHVRFTCSLQGSLAAKRFLRFIGAAIRDNDRVFHEESSSIGNGIVHAWRRHPG